MSTDESVLMPGPAAEPLPPPRPQVRHMQRRADRAVREYNRKRTQADQARARKKKIASMRWELGTIYTSEQATNKLTSKAEAARLARIAEDAAKSVDALRRVWGTLK